MSVGFSTFSGPHDCEQSEYTDVRISTPDVSRRYPTLLRSAPLMEWGVGCNQLAGVPYARYLEVAEEICYAGHISFFRVPCEKLCDVCPVLPD